mgnify:FL=1
MSLMSLELQKITLNPEQSRSVSYAKAGTSHCLIGAAGTGKTTATQQLIIQMLESGLLPPVSLSHKYLPPQGYGFIVTSLTKIAVANLRKKLPDELQGNCINLHKLLEYVPVKTETYSETLKTTITKTVFEPARNKYNPLPRELTVFIIEESSMVDKPILFQNLLNAIHPEVEPIFIFLGDLNQIPPVFGQSILPYKLLELPVVELKEVYRQALGSKIIRLAHLVLSGIPRNLQEVKDIIAEAPNGFVDIRKWPKKFTEIDAQTVAKRYFIEQIEKGKYDPFADIILCPFNKGFGTVDLNNHIASYLAAKYATPEFPVFEVMAGFKKKYFRVGDRVLAEKENAEIISIRRNMAYSGKPVQTESATMNYFGYDEHAMEEDADAWEGLRSVAEDEDSRVHQASHVITVRKTDSDQEVSYNTSKELNDLLLGYVLTIHKAQGSEWRRVFVVFNHSHNKMLSRELLYTGITRAREELIVIGEGDLFEKGILQQRIKGDTLDQKLQWFRDNRANLETESEE